MDQSLSKRDFRSWCAERTWQRLLQAPLGEATAFFGLLNVVAGDAELARGLFESQFPQFMERLWKGNWSFEPKTLSEIFASVKPNYLAWSGQAEEGQALDAIRHSVQEVLAQPFDVNMKALVEQGAYAPGHFLHYGRTLCEIATDGFCRGREQEARRLTAQIVLNSFKAARFEIEELAKAGYQLEKEKLKRVVHELLKLFNQSQPEKRWQESGEDHVGVIMKILNEK
jgi:hypothetical protein